MKYFQTLDYIDYDSKLNYGILYIQKSTPWIYIYSNIFCNYLVARINKKACLVREGFFIIALREL